MTTSDFDLINSLPVSSCIPSEKEQEIMNIFLSPIAKADEYIPSQRSSSLLVRRVTPSLKIAVLNSLILSTLLFGRIYSNKNKFLTNIVTVSVFALLSFIANYFLFFSN